MRTRGGLVSTHDRKERDEKKEGRKEREGVAVEGEGRTSSSGFECGRPGREECVLVACDFPFRFEERGRIKEKCKSRQYTKTQQRKKATKIPRRKRSREGREVEERN